MHTLIKVANAAGSTNDAAINSVIQKIVDNIVQPVVTLLFAFAILVFIWGLFGFFRGGDDSEARTTGRNHILWGVIGMAIMVSVYGIIRFVFNSVGQTPPF